MRTISKRFRHSARAQVWIVRWDSGAEFLRLPMMQAPIGACAFYALFEVFRCEQFFLALAASFGPFTFGTVGAKKAPGRLRTVLHHIFRHPFPFPGV